MQAVDLVLKEVQVEVLSAGTDNPEQFKNLMGTEEVHRVLAKRHKNLPQANAIGLISADGLLISGSRTWPLPVLDLSDRDYFGHFRDYDDAGVFIGAPVRNRLTSAWTFFLARRVSGPHSEFLGVLLAVIEVQYFEEFYEAISPRGGSVSIWRRDGTMIARYPHAENMMGEKLAWQSPWYEVAAKGGGTYRTPGYVDGVARVASVHPLHDYPLVVTVTISESAALADWRRQSILIAVAALCTVIGFAILFRALAARSRKLEQQTVELAAVADALRESEARFRDFALISSDALWETDADHRFRYQSDHIRVIGQSPESRIGRTRLELASDAESEPAKWQEHFALLDRHEPFRDFVYTRKLGAEPEQIISVSGKPLFDPSGRFLGYRGTGRDISKEVLAEHSLREAKASAEGANLAKSQFLANMSHELRTPLNAILGFSEMIKLGMIRWSQSRLEEYAGLIHQSGEHLLAIIGDVLDLAKVEAGKLELHEEESIDPCALLKACVALMEEPANAGRLRLSVNVDPSLPLIVGDATRLKQILLNLLSNAVKFTKPEGSVMLTVRRDNNGGVEFEVRDTGPGMTPAEIKIALEPFGQLDTCLARRHEGTGLGLPLARRLAELHGGSLLIDSEKGHGTTITVTLPPIRVLADTVESADPLSATASAPHVL